MRTGSLAQPVHMVCPRCGADIAPASIRLCRRCGASIDAVGMSAPATGDDDALTQPLDADKTVSANVTNARPTSASGQLAVGQAFGPRYHIIRALGSGGMGAVYQAWDAELAVAVAIKVIRPDVMADPAAAADIERRFKRELLLARQVTHPNVLRIHDLGDIDGMKYITMPFIDGSDLAAGLKHEHRLPVDRVMPIARSIVSGLVAAHKAGVV